MADLLNNRDLRFLLYEFLDVAQLCSRDRFREHSREMFDAILETAEAIANEKYADHNAKGDASGAQFDLLSNLNSVPLDMQDAWF